MIDLRMTVSESPIINIIVIIVREGANILIK